MAPPTPLEAVLTHPLSDPYSLPLSPLAAAAAAILGILAVAFAWPERASHGPRAPEAVADVGGDTGSWAGRLSHPQLAARVLAVALTILAIAAGRLGTESELENLAPALVVGAAWPMLALLSISLGTVWRWVDPWDGAARLLVRNDPGRRSQHVWPALLAALGWTWYLSVFPAPLSPRAVGAALSGYSIYTLAGCLAVGRVRWLSAAEPLGLTLAWMALLPARRLGRWTPPRGAEVLLGSLAGGVLFGAVRRSELWGGLNVAPGALVYGTAGLLLLSALCAGALLAASRGADRAASRTRVVQAAVPVLTATIVAVGLDRNRLFTSLQLLPGLLGDPCGMGWDLLGGAARGLNPAPLGVGGLALAQLAVLVVGGLVGALVLAEGTRRRERAPGAAGLAILTGCSVVGLLAH